MFKYFNISLLSIGFFSLIGCNEIIDYAYLMQHPQVLVSKLKECKDLQNKTPDQLLQCETVYKAAGAMLAFVKEQQMDPGRFGQKIMTAQAQYVKAKQEVDAIEKTIKALQNDQTATSQLETANKQLESAKKASDEAELEMNILLAVIALNTL